MSTPARSASTSSQLVPSRISSSSGTMKAAHTYQTAKPNSAREAAKASALPRRTRGTTTAGKDR
jgi:hypothetical protein